VKDLVSIGKSTITFYTSGRYPPVGDSRTVLKYKPMAGIPEPDDGCIRRMKIQVAWRVRYFLPDDTFPAG
jgi:hypothetical protein